MDFKGIFFNTTDYIDTDTILGEGSFGKVYLVENVNDGTRYAAKIINVQNIFSGEDQMALMRESSILQKLSHPAIVKFYGINFHNFEDPTQLQPTILTEYLPNGSFKEVINKSEHGLADSYWNATKKCICIIGIVDAMRYLHQKGILHRDLKPENVLIDSNFYPRVCDFGFSRCFSNSITKSMELSMSGKIGTPLYMPPELLENKGHFGFGIDVYAFAFLAYEIVSGKEPYSKNGKSISFPELVKKVYLGERPEFGVGFTEKMKNLIARCWSKNIDERPSFNEIFNELSNDFASFFDEDVDDFEINNYLLLLDDERKKEEKKKNQNEIFLEIIKKLVDSQNDLNNICFDSIGDNILNMACKSGNIDLVKYLISSKKIDINSKIIFNFH